MDIAFKSNISSNSYKSFLLICGFILGVIPLCFGVFIVLTLDPLDILGAISLSFGIWVLWGVFYSLYIKPSVWSMIIVEGRVVWNTMHGIEYVKIEDIQRIEAFPDRQDDIAIRIQIHDKSIKILKRDNCRNVKEAVNTILKFKNIQTDWK